MATGTIKRPTGESAVTDVTSSFVTNSYYGRTNNDPVKFVRNGNVVTVNATIRCDSPYTTYPGTAVLSGLPKAAFDVTVNFPTFGAANDGVVPLWARVTTGGDLNLRYGTVDKNYNLNFTYICA